MTNGGKTGFSKGKCTINDKVLSSKINFIDSPKPMSQNMHPSKIKNQRPVFVVY